MAACKYCGQDAGWFNQVHVRCRQKYERDLQDLKPAPVKTAPDSIGSSARTVAKSSNLKYWGIGITLLWIVFLSFWFTYPRWWSDPSERAVFAVSIAPGVVLLILSTIPRTRSGLILLMIAGLTLMSGCFVAGSNFMIMEKRKLTSEAKPGLGWIYNQATRVYMENGTTFEVSDISQLGSRPLQDNFRYSIWYSVKGIPTAIPLPAGNRYKPGPCDVTTPPTSVVAASATGFTAVAKGNLDSDATCDEWSINNSRQMNHEIDDIEQ